MSHRHGHNRHGRPRQYSDDEEEGSRTKRSRVEHDELLAKERLENLIVQLGSNSTIEQHETLQNDIHDLSVLLESEIGKFKDTILGVLVACASERPDKLRVYATLVALINLRNHAFVGEFLERLVKELRSELQSPGSSSSGGGGGEAATADWQCVLCSVRFLAELASHRVVSPASLLQLYNAFMGVTLEEGIPQARSDCFVHLVLASLPWAAGAIAAKHPSELAQLLASIDSYRARRSLAHLPTVQSLAGQEDWIDSLWHQVQSLSKSGWTEKCSVRYEAFASMLSSPDAASHNLPAMAPQPHDESSAAAAAAAYPMPRAVFRLFDYTDVPEDGPGLPGEHSIERYLVEEQLAALLACHWHDRRDCAKALLNARFGVKVPLAFMLTELALGEMLRLPVAERLHLFYCSLLIELCKEDPETMPNVVAQATFALFDRLDSVNAECAGRLARWFSYHLSQCKYQWSWPDWTEECQRLPGPHPKLVFLRDTAQLLVRFSYYDHVKQMLGKQLAPVLLHPQQPECQYKYDKEEDFPAEVVTVAHRLIDAIRERCTPDKAVEVLSQLPGDGDEAHMLLKVDVFFSTLLFLGSKTFSHSFAALAKFHPVCKALVPPDSWPAKRRLLDCLYECWRWHEQMLLVLLDKLVKVQLLDCRAVFRWLFGSGGLPRRELSRGFVWDAAASTLAKMCKHRARLTDEWAAARKRYEAYHEKMRSGGGAGDSAATMLDSAEQAQQPMDSDEAADGQQQQQQPAAAQPPQQVLVEEDTPTREELDGKLARVDQAVAELADLVAALVSCGCGCGSIAGEEVRVDDEPDGGAGDGGQFLAKLLRERSLALLTAHYNDAKPALQRLRSQPSVLTSEPAVCDEVRKFCDAFFALSD